MSKSLVLMGADTQQLAGPLGSLDAYIERVSRIPVLTREQEVELAQRFRRDDDLEAARQLVLSHLRFVVHIARGYVGYGLPMGDLVQEGNVGLMKAVRQLADNGMAVVLVEQFAALALAIGNRAYVLRRGRMVYDGGCEALARDPAHLHRLYLGDAGQAA